MSVSLSLSSSRCDSHFPISSSGSWALPSRNTQCQGPFGEQVLWLQRAAVSFGTCGDQTKGKHVRSVSGTRDLLSFLKKNGVPFDEEEVDTANTPGVDDFCAAGMLLSDEAYFVAASWFDFLPLDLTEAVLIPGVTQSSKFGKL